MQWSKIHNTLYFGGIALTQCQGNGTLQVILGAFAMAMAVNAAVGVHILYQVYGQQSNNSVIVENFLDDQPEAEVKIYNCRLPQVLQQNELSAKMFSKGWKFDLFNSKGQTCKVLAAVSVIFAQIYFSLAAVVMSETPAMGITVFAYSGICLFSFLNVSYVRDFDVVQINMTPISLAVLGLTCLMGHFDFTTLGMTLALVADSYFALRYKQDDSDLIEYSTIELFAQESWTQQAFDRTSSMGLQITAISMIFLQLFFAMAGSVNGQIYQPLFLAFYMARLLQFFFSTVKGMQMLQSNLVGVILAGIAVCNMGLNLTALQAIFMIVDAYIGAILFVITKNIEVSKWTEMIPLSVSSKIQKRIRLVDVFGQQDQDECFQKC
jgi:hypothetical protein